MDPRPPGTQARLRPTLIAACGVAAVAGLILIGPAAAQSLLGAMGPGPGPSPALAELVFTVVIFGAMLAGAIAGGAASNIRVLAPGDGAGRAAAFGAALGLGGVLASLGYAALAGRIIVDSGRTASPVLIVGVLAVGLQVVAEEAYFRGWLQPLLARAYGTGVAVASVAAIFAALHALGGATGPLALLNMFGGGLLFGWLAARGGGVAGSVAAHFAWNATEQLLLGLDPNPGIGSFGALIDLDLAGPALWGGSDQGLNSSLGMTSALAAILMPLLLARGKRQPMSPRRV